MTARQIVVELLNRLETEDRLADRIIDDELERPDLTAQDRAFINEIMQGTLRWRKKIQWLLQPLLKETYSRVPRSIRHILESSLYQILYMSKTPSYAAVNEAVNLTKKLKGSFWARRVNAILRKLLRELPTVQFPEIATDPVTGIAINYSHPEWLVTRWIERWGIAATQQLCSINNQRPAVSMRVNPLKMDPVQLLEKLAQHGIAASPSPLLPNFLRARQLPPLAQCDLFQQGYFSIQDESAGLVAPLLSPAPGEIILDLCAAPGGKTMQLAELTADQAQIMAVDAVRPRLQMIQENVARLGFRSVTTILADGLQFATRPLTKILLDVPCSGLGVLAKRADLRWQRNVDAIQERAQLQRQFISHAASLLAKGGVLVYSTCSIEPEENEQIIEWFLKQQPDFELTDPSPFVPAVVVTAQRYVQTLPHLHHVDGSFAARLVRRQ
ncbi:16S rRNA (cytosine(967)-C(5))-methyltransferase RsmB [candidate division KSB1 bacterium]|nr:16S rRNA (cytosine(967)-C(5))-methyltransferase RsmB [candidate division KSB1 bacterium]